MVDAISLLRRHNIRPSKGLAQNFLIDESVRDRIIEVSSLQPDDVVLEVGPGLGLLTRRLAQRAATVVAVELDQRMLPVLADTLQGRTNAHIVQGDILEIDAVAELARVLGMPDPTALRYKVVANLPYYLTSRVLRHLLAARPRPEEITVMVQREVAERIVAAPGRLSLLAISIQVFGKPEIACRVSASAFHPRPKVDSAVLHIEVYTSPRIAEDEIARFFHVVRAGFAQRRKQMHNALTHNLHIPRESVFAALASAGIASHRRAQTLSIEEWARLARALPVLGDQESHGEGNATTTMR